MGKDVEILSIQSCFGRNVFSHKPIVKMVIDVNDLYKSPTRDIEGFNGKLIELLPGLLKHCCSAGYEGGFLERLIEGTYIPHVIEHIILELQYTMGYDIRFGKTRAFCEPSIYNVIFEYSNERCGMECAKAAVYIVNCLVKNKAFDMEGILLNLKKIAIESELGPSTKAIFDEAKKRGIPVTRLGNESLIRLGYGKYSRLLEASLTDYPSCIAVDIASNKHLTKQLLSDNDIPVPYGDIAYTEQSTVDIAYEIGYPVVIKPLDVNQGKGVTINIRNEKEVRDAYFEAQRHSKTVVVEKYIPGKDYRVLVVGDKVSAVAERRSPLVTGDGIHTIRELVEIENSSNARGEDHEKPLTKIKLDSIAKQVLLRKGIKEYYVPAKGETVNLRENGNISTGGTARDCTAEIHPQNAMLAVKAAKVIGLDIAGIDITAGDISNPIDRTNGAVIEVNAAPGLRMHLYPSQGSAKNVAADILSMLFPDNAPCSIPIISVTGTNGKTTTTRLIKFALSLTGMKVGMTSTSGIYVGNECIQKGDNTGPVSARILLSNKEIEAAVLETARGGIIRRGLGYDLADIGVIVNISDDHIGYDGINTLEDLAFVKAVVIEAVKPDGYAVLNADDCMTGCLLERVKCNAILFSKEKNNIMVLNHLKSGGKVLYKDGNTLFIHDGIRKIRLIDIKEIPITIDGVADCNIENSLAAASALYAMNVPLEIIKMGLKLFKPDPLLNPGRFNMFDMGNFKIMLDYGHNTAGYNAVINSIEKINALRYVGIIGMPGDRLDRNIREAGEIAGRAFSKIYIKEDEDLRGRKKGEVAQLFYDAITKKGVKKENIEIIHSELKALEKAILDAQPGDLIVMFYEKFEPAIELINKLINELARDVVEPVAMAASGDGRTC